VEAEILDMTKTVVEAYVNMYTGEGNYFDDWDLEGLKKHVESSVLVKNNVVLPEKPESREMLTEAILAKCHEVLSEKRDTIGEEQLQNIERAILLRSVDSAWMEHIDNMDHLKQGIGLRAYGQNDPVKAYTKEGFDLFDDMVMQIQENTVRYLFSLEIKSAPKEEKTVDFSNMKTNEAQIEGNTPGGQQRKNQKVGRNDPCPCGSGKKYKKCCGA
ncbi:MAG: preprotein translocase subunit SecA, partial [Eubacteriaceae bacterium]|nr:preprotein translocase subunit SecA [Eubacteriaceae bacterium]